MVWRLGPDRVRCSAEGGRRRLSSRGVSDEFLDDSIRVAARDDADGVDVTLEVWPGHVYVFQVGELPESREAIEHIADFMRESLSEARQKDLRAQIKRTRPVGKGIESRCSDEPRRVVHG